MALDIVTLAPEEVARFLLRHRRTETLERYEPRLDHFLREILNKANEFVPSESGAILLDDPRAKLFDHPQNALTCIAAFGADAEQGLGRRHAHDQGTIGEVYTRVRSMVRAADAAAGVESLLAVPVVVGNSVCGVLKLVNRRDGGAFTRENCALLEIFAGYISSSVQNALDGLRAREVARRDHLTGLFNERYFNFRLREEIRRAKLEKSPLTMLFIDLDLFKEVNDQFGHLVGSRTLHEVGLLLETESPAGAVAARYGGDEFVLLLPYTDLAGATRVGETLRHKVELGNFVDGKSGAITVSVGVAAFGDDVRPGGNPAEQANALIRLADAAMYQAKACGKNRVVCAKTEGGAA